MKKILSIIFSLLFIFTLVPIVQAGLNDAFGNGSMQEIVGQKAGFETAGENNLENTISNVITLVLSFLGIIFISLLIYGGVNWMTAGGNESKIESSKKLIKQAIIGIIVVLGAYTITYFILNNLTDLVL